MSDTEANLAAFAAESARRAAAQTLEEQQAARIRGLEFDLALARRETEVAESEREEQEDDASWARIRLEEERQRYNRLRACLIRRSGALYAVPNLHHLDRGPTESQHETLAQAEAELERVLAAVELAAACSPAPPRSTL